MSNVLEVLTDQLIADLQQFDTPTVCNALEILTPERRGFGYTTFPLVCTRPELPPIVAYARTATIASVHPNTLQGAEARALADAYYEYIDTGPKPSVVLIQDLDGDGGYGCFWGEVNSNIHLGLGCLGVITDGGVRDLPDVASGFQMLAASILPSHAFVHAVDFGRPVTVAGMRVSPNDIIHADQHGAVIIPAHAANGVKAAAETIARQEAVIIRAAQQPNFNARALREAQGEADEIH